jgi:predicted  nucleic acid-binding Zn-ribbon protein
MRRPVQIILVLLIVVFAGATAFFFQRYQKASQDYQVTKTAEDAARNQYVEVLGAIGEIQDSLNAIAVGDSAARALTTRSRELPTAPDRAEALQRIALLNQSIQRAREKITTLETRLARSRTRMTGLEKLVANLKKNVGEREEQVAALNTQVEQLQTQVTGLTETVAQNQDTIRVKEEVIAEKQKELGTVYYVVGTKKELENKGIITSKGGVLGLGKTTLLTARVDESAFTAMDTDVETVVRTPGVTKIDKVEVLSPQRVGTYELRLGEDGRVELHILDPAEFRKIKHLVIMTKA